MFRLTERPIDELPIRIARSVELGAPPDEVFAVLADHDGWTTWFGGMSRVRIDGLASGVGALRTVSVPPARVQERFSAWAAGERLTFHVVASTLPGLAAMTEDWRLEPLDGERTKLTIDVGAAPARWLPFAGMVAAAVRRATRGATGIRDRFPLPA